VAGAWFAVGAALSRVWEHAASPIGAPLFGSTRQALELIGCFYGLGAAIVGLAAFAAGRFVSRPAVAQAAVEPPPYAETPVASVPAATAVPPDAAERSDPSGPLPARATAVAPRERRLIRRRKPGNADAAASPDWGWGQPGAGSGAGR
jgi:hypothetical protein